MKLEEITKACGLLEEARKIFANGPFEYYLKTLATSNEYMMNRFSPFKNDDRVALVCNLDIPPGSGWWSCRHFLIKDAAGTVKSVECSGDGFKYDVEFDNETFLDPATFGFKSVCKKHTFSMKEEDLKHLNKKEEKVMKLCKDCKFLGGTHTFRCEHEKNSNGIDMVLGEGTYKYSPYELRNDDGINPYLSKFGIESKIDDEICGPEGKWFEPITK
jgi:hypothetical protein